MALADARVSSEVRFAPKAVIAKCALNTTT